MKKAVHFGAGNIGRGFIGEILHKNGFEIAFVDVNTTVIDALNSRHSYEIGIADPSHAKIAIDQVRGINNKENPSDVISAIAEADVVTTAIGPNILPFIAELIAKGIAKRHEMNNTAAMDILACENMIGGTEFLHEKVAEHLESVDLEFARDHIGFPNAAVDRIVPGQHHEDPLYVEVEPFCEWVVDESQMKSDIRLEGVHYATDLEPFIERKLFSVNSGHATVAYNAAYKGYKTILESLQDEEILSALKAVQKETRSLLLAKWGEYFTEKSLLEYHNVIISRFANPEIIDDVTRVARTPIRKLGYDERFIRPIRELNDRGLNYSAHMDVVGKIFSYKDSEDPQAVELQDKLASEKLEDLVKEVTGLTDEKLISEVVASVQKYI
ncbi:MAG: mannitol-1-phosphate 5-dehydrogenase [Streptococcaceae bacterium]|jgi:mannitol-1-phosphate 5-dehydrogenase|nr:mannitol-1-phosphate 5-dehydrogenase [Streptococcaceae bacterium]